MEKLIVYGTGGGARTFIQRIKGEPFEIIAVTDSYADNCDGKYFEDVKILSLKKCLEQDFDAIVICALAYETEIKEFIKNHYTHMEKVMNKWEFYRKYILAEQHEELLCTNDLYKFFNNEKHNRMHKWIHYFKVYSDYFEKYRGTDVVFMEIGVARGGSMQMWSEYFGEKATIIGIDINEECRQYEKDNVKIEIGSQSDCSFWDYIKSKYPRVDILLDDGGHTMEQQIVTFENMFSHISDGGIYMCEDCQTSYYSSYGGGYKKQGSFIEYAKNFVDDINAYYWQGADVAENYFARNAVGLHFWGSIVLVEKQKVKFPFAVEIDNKDI